MLNMQAVKLPIDPFGQISVETSSSTKGADLAALAKDNPEVAWVEQLHARRVMSSLAVLRTALLMCGLAEMHAHAHCIDEYIVRAPRLAMADD